MAFQQLERQLLDACVKDAVNLEAIRALIADGADINAFDGESEQSLYGEILDYYMDSQDVRRQLPNLSQITKLFIENGLVLNPRPADSDFFLPDQFRFMQPDTICVDIFKMLLEKLSFSFDDLQSVISNATLDLHLGEYFFYQCTDYSKEDSLRYYLELIYWACAYLVKVYPDQCPQDLKSFPWFEREKNKVELIRERRSTAVFAEALETHQRAEIQGWTMKY